MKRKYTDAEMKAITARFNEFSERLDASVNVIASDLSLNESQAWAACLGQAARILAFNGIEHERIMAMLIGSLCARDVEGDQ